MTNELQTIDNNSMMIIESLDINKAKTQMKAIQEFQEMINKNLQPGHDYGQAFFGSKKPSLLKPGAEKILMLMGLSSEYEIIEKIQNYEDGFFAYTIRCLLKRGDTLITEGLGHCNSKEKKYESEKQDKYMLGNTCLKMAKKRAQVDAALTVGSLSGIFTQDIEDMVFETNERVENLTYQEAQDTLIDFGKYRGKRLIDILKLDNQYVEWLKDNARDAYVKQAANLILEGDNPVKPTQEQNIKKEENVPEFLKEEAEENKDLPF